MKISPFRHIPLAGLFIVLLAGCVGISANITLDDNGSGRIELDYQISRLVAHLGTAAGDDPVVTLPLNRDDFGNSPGPSQTEAGFPKTGHRFQTFADTPPLSHPMRSHDELRHFFGSILYVLDIRPNAQLPSCFRPIRQSLPWDG